MGEERGGCGGRGGGLKGPLRTCRGIRAYLDVSLDLRGWWSGVDGLYTE